MSQAAKVLTDVRHHRQQILSQVGEAGQEALRSSSALVVGMGGLGCPAALYLAAAGVGRLGLLDDQEVELSNLQRQVLFADADRGRPKPLAAGERLQALDPAIELVPLLDTFRADNAERILRGYDVVIDGTDAFETKFLLSDAAVITRARLVHGAVLGWAGQVSTIVPGGACLRCLFREPPDMGAVPSCEEAGILGPVTGVVGSFQALEAIKVLLKTGDLLSGRILQFDGLRGSTRVTTFPRDPDCPACSEKRWITDLSHYADQVSPRGHLITR
jgi:molybdopterin/thiamine biosynthesis adenylyltransferase